MATRVDAPPLGNPNPNPTENGNFIFLVYLFYGHVVLSKKTLFAILRRKRKLRFEKIAFYSGIRYNVVSNLKG